MLNLVDIKEALSLFSQRHHTTTCPVVTVVVEMKLPLLILAFF
jgi:hypothetical protein